MFNKVTIRVIDDNSYYVKFSFLFMMNCIFLLASSFKEQESILSLCSLSDMRLVNEKQIRKSFNVLTFWSVHKCCVTVTCCSGSGEISGE